MASVSEKLLLIFFYSLIYLKDNRAVAKERNIDVTSFVTLKEYDDTWIHWKTLRLTKAGRNKFVISGDFTFQRNMADDQSVEIKVFRKSERSKNNNTVVYYEKKTICKYMAYDKRVYPHLLQHSNLPAKDVCPFPKGDYTFNSFVLESSSIPPVVPNGEYKVIVLFYDNTKCIAGLEFEVTITDPKDD